MNLLVKSPDGWSILHETDRHADVQEGAAIALEGPDESNHGPVQIQNACGHVLLTQRRPEHVAWQKVPSIFGMVRRAYTRAGNLCARKDSVLFKGAVDVRSLEAVLRLVIPDSYDQVVLPLIVLSVGIGRCLYINVGCLLETRLARFPWISVMNRIEEVCSIVVFYVRDWEAMERALGVALPCPPANTTAVTVTRKGTLTLRLAWDGIPWQDNTAFNAVVLHLREFVRGLLATI